MCRLLAISRRSPGLLRVEMDLRFLSLWCSQLLLSQMPQQVWDWDQGLLWKGSTVETGLLAVPAHPAKGAGPKASNFGTRQGVTSQEHTSARPWLCCICNQGSLFLVKCVVSDCLMEEEPVVCRNKLPLWGALQIKLLVYIRVVAVNSLEMLCFITKRSVCSARSWDEIGYRLLEDRITKAFAATKV